MQGCILAPDLFCVAIDWILDHMGVKPHLEVGGQIFSDLAYADDTAFPFSSEDNITPCLHSFSQTAATLGLRTSWAKTKLQNLGSGPSPTSLQIDGNGVELFNCSNFICSYFWILPRSSSATIGYLV